MTNRLTLLLLLLAVSIGARAQTYELPAFYGQYFNDPQINAIQINQDRDAYFLLGHRRNSGSFAGVNTSLFYGQVKFGGGKSSSFHTAGLQFISVNEGASINRDRIALSYSHHLQITSDYMLAGSFTAGFYNFSIKANEVTGGFSSYAFDGSFGLKLYSNKTAVSLVLNQVTNSSIVPVSTEVILARNLNLYAHHQFTLSEAVLQPSIYTRYSQSTDNIYSGFAFTGGVQALLKEKVMLGAAIETGVGVHTYFGIENIQLGATNFGVNFSYFLPNKNNISMNVQRFELMLSCSILSKK